MNVDLVNGYRAAFQAANPGVSVPLITYHRGWYRLSNLTKPVRESKLAEMRDVLLKRAAEAQQPTTQEGK
ncbi:hypothetical protein [Pseudomonas aeruginosa]|uniref:hypothetical protein n=1 Tax=Pseudomonas aeruginosa TaxID=287 RepID=UPI0013CE0AC8|nr:hypothetical protein [Pseudomonas aeruginosa]